MCAIIAIVTNRFLLGSLHQADDLGLYRGGETDKPLQDSEPRLLGLMWEYKGIHIYIYIYIYTHIYAYVYIYIYIYVWAYRGIYGYMRVYKGI